MKLNVLLVISSIYMILLGIGFVFVPKGIGIGAVPAEATVALIAYLRVFGSTFIAIAVLDWTARNAESSTALNAIVLANTVGFGLAGLLDVWGFLSGGRQLAMVFAVIHFLFAAAFIWSGRQSMSTKAT